jgi:hypothetical protein
MLLATGIGVYFLTGWLDRREECRTRPSESQAGTSKASAWSRALGSLKQQKITSSKRSGETASRTVATAMRAARSAGKP